MLLFSFKIRYIFSFLFSQDNYSDSDDDVDNDIVAEEIRALIGNALADCLPPVNAADEAEKPLGRGVVTLDDMSMDELIKVRRAHETEYAARGLRTRHMKSTAPDANKVHEESVQQQLVKEFHKLFKGSRVSSGLDRQARWQEVVSGNQANARVVASLTSAQVQFSESYTQFQYLLSLTFLHRWSRDGLRYLRNFQSLVLNLQ